MSDMTLTQAANEVRKLARGFKAIELVETALDKVAALEQQESALTAAIAEKTQILQALSDEGTALRAELDEEEQASITRSNAHIAATAQQADILVAEAAAKVQAGLDAFAEREREFDSAKAAHEENLTTLQEKIEIAKQELTTIDKKTEEAKKKLSAFIEG